jgi:hypothetical protein
VSIPVESSCSKTVALFDHFVSAGEHGGGNIDAQRLCGFEIDHDAEFRWQNDRQFAWLLTLHDPADINTGLAIRVDSAGTVADQATGIGLLPISENGWQSVTRHQNDQLDSLGEEKGIGTDDECANLLLFYSGESIVYLGLGACIASELIAPQPDVIFAYGLGIPVCDPPPSLTPLPAGE